MKILVVVPSLIELGPIIVAELIAKNSNDRHIEYIFLSLRKNTPEILRRFSEFKIFELAIGDNPLKRFFKSKINIIKQIENIQPNVIHVHSFWPTVFLANSKFHSKTITTIHNNPKEDFVFAYGKFIGYFMSFFMLKAQKKLARRVAISEYIKNIHIKYKLKKIDVIYNGIENFSEFGESLSEKKTIKLILVSALIPRKNVFMAIDIIRELKDRRINVSLEVIGDGKEKKNLMQYAVDRGVKNQVLFKGNMERKIVLSAINCSDILLLTSKSEGFGLVVVEAMMLGKPAIVYDIPVMHELIESEINGAICQSIEGFADKVMLFSKKNKKKLYFDCKGLFMERFLASEMSKKYECIYKEIANKGTTVCT